MKVVASDEFHLMLMHLHRGGNFGYWHILPDRESYWWPAGQPEELRVGSSDHVYYGVHPTTKIPPTNADGDQTKPLYVRGQKKYIAAINCLIAEFDTKQFKGDLQLVMSHIRSIPFQPSIQILSGGGIHAYWLLRSPFIIKSSADRKQIIHIHREWSITVKGDASKDITRVLRVPGTFNPKYNPPQLVMFLEFAMDRLYDLDDLSGILPPPLDPASTHSIRNDVIWQGNGSGSAIEQFNSQVKVTDLLQKYGYKWHGHGKMLSPHSSTGSPGVTVDENANRAFVHHTSDPLGDGYWKRAFDIIKMLEYNGSFKLALDAIQGSI